MRKFMFALAVFMLLLSCVRQQEQQDLSSDNTFSQSEIITPTETIVLADSTTAVIDERGYREYIEDYDPKLVKIFEVEGNYTNSRNRELLVFYQKRSLMFIEGEKRDSIEMVYCFVLDSVNEKVQMVFKIPVFETAPPFTGENNIDKDPMEELGRDVIWLDHRIGCIGDFNENGKEELYLISSFAIGVDPYFYEFNGTEFVEITDRHYGFARIKGVDKENKIISFKRTSKASGDFSLKWNEEKQIYEFLEDD